MSPAWRMLCWAEKHRAPLSSGGFGWWSFTPSLLGFYSFSKQFDARFLLVVCQNEARHWGSWCNLSPHPDTPGRKWPSVPQARRRFALSASGSVGSSGAGLRLPPPWENQLSTPRAWRLSQHPLSSRNGLPVRADGHRVHQSPDGTLLIHNLRARDEGSYTCSAYRGSQAVSRSTEVKVVPPGKEGPPQAPACLQELECVAGRGGHRLCSWRGSASSWLHDLGWASRRVA